MQHQYEFTDQENAIIRTTSLGARAWGALSIFVGACQIILGALALAKAAGVTAISTFVGGLVSVVVGIVFIAVAAGLEGVVATRGNDIVLMMAALRRLSAAFTIQIVVTVLAFVGGFVAGMLGFAA